MIFAGSGENPLFKVNDFISAHQLDTLIEQSTLVGFLLTIHSLREGHDKLVFFLSHRLCNCIRICLGRNHIQIRSNVGRSETFHDGNFIIAGNLASVKPNNIASRFSPHNIGDVLLLVTAHIYFE